MLFSNTQTINHVRFWKRRDHCRLKWLGREPLVESRGKTRFWTTIWVSSKSFVFLFSQCGGQACGQEPRQSSLASHQESLETAVGLSELAQEDQMGHWPHPPHWQGWNPGLQRSLQTSCPLACHIASYSTGAIWKSLKWKKHAYPHIFSLFPLPCWKASAFISPHAYNHHCQLNQLTQVKTHHPRAGLSSPYSNLQLLCYVLRSHFW